MKRVELVNRELRACRLELSRLGGLRYLGALADGLAEQKVEWDDVVGFFRRFKKLFHEFRLDKGVKDAIGYGLTNITVRVEDEAVVVDYIEDGDKISVLFMYAEGVVEKKTYFMINPENPVPDWDCDSVVRNLEDMKEAVAQFLEPVNDDLDAVGLAELFVTTYFKVKKASPPPLPNFLKPNPRPTGDILYENADVCILRPDAVGGMVVVFRVALGDELIVRRDGLQPSDGYVAFQAPAFKRKENMASKPTESDIDANYPVGGGVSKNSMTVCIRIDPARTYVYSKLARKEGRAGWRSSRRALYDYISIMGLNKADTVRYDVFNAMTHELVGAEKRGITGPDNRYEWPYRYGPINTSAVILVDRIIPAAWLVKFRW